MHTYMHMWKGNSRIERIIVSQFSFLSILFYYFRKIPFPHSLLFSLLLFRYTDGQRIIFHFSFPFLLLCPWFQFFFFFDAGSTRRNVFALFTLATGLTKRFSWPQIEKWNLLDLCVLFVLYMDLKFIIQSKRKFSNREI